MKKNILQALHASGIGADSVVQEVELCIDCRKKDE
jgi:hypothetical protein